MISCCCFGWFKVNYGINKRVRKCFGNSFFFRDFLFLVGGGFRAVQAPFWGNPGVKCRFRVAFQDIWKCF